MDAPEDPTPSDGTATLVRPRRRPTKEKKRREVPKWSVVLWNDEHHTYDYVIAMLKELFGHPVEKGFQLAQKVDSEGKGVVLTTTKEHAELKRDQIHAFGDAGLKDCLGSMSATIESAE